jgi:hypothetical protein
VIDQHTQDVIAGMTWALSTMGGLLVVLAAWGAYRQWLLAGNAPDPMPAPVVVPPTQAEIDALAEIEARTAMRSALRADATIQYLRTHTPAEAATYASNAITDLASAKVVIGKLTMLVAYLARERLAAE